MQVTDADIARIPRGNVRVSVAEFVEVWRAGERRNEEQTARGVRDWYAAGVIMTCRWMATATVRPNDGRSWYPARAPVTSRTRRAYEELIQAEYIEAEKLQFRNPRPDWVRARGAWIDAVAGTLRWAWARRGGSPLEVPDVDALA